MKFRRSFTLILLASLLAAVLGLVKVPSAHAAQTLTVTDCTSDAQLQAAVSTANSDNAGDTITFTCSGAIPLTKSLLIFGDMTLDGSGQSVTLDGGNKVEVLFVNDKNFTLNALTIAHGKTTSSGGGISTGGGTVNINNSTFANNSADGGGGISTGGGMVNINNSTFANNSSSGGNGGGGGISSGEGTVNINNSTFANNSASGGSGGGIDGGTVNINNSTFVNNSARDYGGGINDNGVVNINNSTFANNSSGSDGGGIESINTASISNSTFVNNSAVIGGGIEISGSTGSIGGSIVANNTGGNCSLLGASLTDQGYNLESGTDCGFTGTGSLQNTDPKLDPNGLQNNGGPTQTIALLSSSPAIDHIPAANCPASDQRGMTRPDDGETTCDIGAYESNYAPVDNDLGLANMPTTITTNATSPQGAVVTYTPPTATDESGDSSTASVTCTPASGSTFAIGTTTVTCTVSDSDDTNSPVSQSFTVTVKQGLTASGKSVSATEGTDFSGVVATGTAYGTGTLSASITWGDGNTSAGTVTLNPDGSYSVAGSHTYGEEGSSFAITVQVSASGGLSATGTGSTAVADAALKAFVTKVVIKGNTVLLTTGFADADPNGTASDYTATINWGDGTTSPGTIMTNKGGRGFSATGFHKYHNHGTFTVTVTIKDAGGSSTTITTKV